MAQASSEGNRAQVSEDIAQVSEVKSING